MLEAAQPLVSCTTPLKGKKATSANMASGRAMTELGHCILGALHETGIIAAELMQTRIGILHALCGSATPRASRQDSVPASFLVSFQGP